MAPNAAQKLREFILNEVTRRVPPHEGIQHLTVGLEHEFFLIGPSGSPADHAESQAFLNRLGRSRGWYVRETSTTSDDERMIWRCSEESTNGRFTAVKYDHHPHLMEIALPYERDLFAFREILKSKFEVLDVAAAQSGCTIWHKPHLQIPANDPRVTSSHEVFRKLRHYRGRLFDKRNEPQDPAHVNYAAIIAATQTHIGGTAWWNNPELVEMLYCLEPSVLAAGTAAFPEEARQTVLRARWEGYRSVFKGYPLVGFPDLAAWNFEEWVGALLNSPLAGSPDDPWSGKSAAEYGGPPNNDWSKGYALIRDLQIIRPRLFGTLEFRADPAQPSVAHILGMMALRLGLVASLQKPRSSSAEYREAKARWWQQVSGNAGVAINFDRAILDSATSALSLRGYGEEVFLNVFSEV